MLQGFGSSVIGTSHLKNGTECQDAYQFRMHRRYRIGVAAVADGLGSAKHAAIGARLVTRRVVDELQKCVDRVNIQSKSDRECLMRASFKLARQCLLDKAFSDRNPINQYATTLLVVVIYKEWVITAHIGDGGIVAQSQEGDLLMLSAPEEGEFANIVTPITSSKAISTLRISSYHLPNARIALFTDGLQNLALINKPEQPYHPFAGFFAPFFDVIQSSADLAGATRGLQKFLGSERVCAKTTDDKTLVILG